MNWERAVPTLTDGAYWVEVWGPDDNSIDLCVIKLPDKTYWVADNEWADGPVNDIGPYTSLEDAQAVAEMLAAQGINLMENGNETTDD